MSKDQLDQQCLGKSRWQFPDARDLPPDSDFITAGADLEPETLIEAYASGYFPMPVRVRRKTEIGWFSPDPRGIIPLAELKVSRSLQRSLRRYRVTFDTCFAQTMANCADPSREGAWINEPIETAYLRLHQLGYAHSVEVWSDLELVGGLYGVSVGGLFAGESMFHHSTDASKVALVHLIRVLDDGHQRLLDIQWSTDHLASLGAIELDRSEYLTRLRTAIELPQPTGFNDPGHLRRE